MPSRKVEDSTDGLIALAKEMGLLSGSQQAVLSELQRLNTELTKLSAELDVKHEENIRRIDLRHAENLKALETHKEDDNRNFNKIFSMWNKIAGGIALLVILWGILKFFVPLLIAAKSLGE